MSNNTENADRIILLSVVYNVDILFLHTVTTLSGVNSH